VQFANASGLSLFSDGELRVQFFGAATFRSFT